MKKRIENVEAPSGRMEIEVGDLLFVSGNEWSSRLIKFFLRSRFSHVTIATGPNEICEVELFRRMEIIPNPYTEYVLYRVEGGLTSNQQLALIDFLKEKCRTNIGYDWWRVLSIVVRLMFKKNLIIHEMNRYICSEIVDKAYQHIGIDLVEDRETGDVTPLDLLYSKEITPVR